MTVPEPEAAVFFTSTSLATGAAKHHQTDLSMTDISLHTPCHHPVHALLRSSFLFSCSRKKQRRRQQGHKQDHTRSHRHHRRQHNTTDTATSRSHSQLVTIVRESEADPRSYNCTHSDLHISLLCTGCSCCSTCHSCVRCP